MARFIVLYNSSVPAREQMANATPEQQKAGMDAWMAWAGKAGGAIVDLGTPMQSAARVTAAGVERGNSEASGYSILEADSEEDVEALLDGHPHLMMPGSSIEVFEALPVPGT